MNATLSSIYVVLPAMVSWLAMESAWAANWQRYTNPRFGASAEYPADMVEPQPPPSNGDGLAFKSKDGTLRVSIFGSFIVLTDDFETYKAYRLSIAKEDGVDITYSAGGKDWMAYSGTKDDSIVYFKMIPACDGAATSHVGITYPKSKKPQMDKIVERIAKSLRSEKGSDGP